MPKLRPLSAALLILTLSGCKPEAKKPGAQPAVAAAPKPSKPAPPPSKEELEARDRCSERLSDIGGLFLMYGMMKHQLPESLDELRALPGASAIGDFVCPASGKPYIYDREGKPAPSGTGRVILADPTPAHSGLRLCLVMTENPSSGAMVTKVVALPDSFFTAKE